ncbi:MAG: hypothetical protein AAFO95_11430, partial [Cyanobacteria bacterium J06600_6]
MKYTKLSPALNSCLLSGFLLLSFLGTVAHSQTQESVIPESDITDASSSVGDIGSDGGGTTSGTSTGGNNSVSVPAVNDAAADITTELDAGTVDVTTPEGAPIEVSADVQQSVADVAASGGATTTPGAAKVSAGGTEISVNGVGGVAGGISAAIDSGGSEVVVESDQATVTCTIEPQTISILENNVSKLASVPSNKSLKLKSEKTPQLDSKLLTVKVEAFNKTTLETNVYKLTGELEVVKSAAGAITALSLGGASKANIDLANSIIFNTKIQPENLVDLMLNYQGLLSNSSMSEVESEPSQPGVNFVKLENAIEAHNQIITNTEPEVFKELMNNG